MQLSTWQDWVAWAGIVIPLASLAWAALAYVRMRRWEISNQEFEKFFKVMDHLGQSSNAGTISAKMAAAYELRKYPQYKEVIIRLCEGAVIEGPAAELFREELRLTADYMRTRQ